jgi:sigma-B regulation protein RsbU (phosphoserine phosphatase)
MIYIVFLIILFFMFLKIVRNQSRAYNAEIATILRKLREKEEYPEVIDILRDDYDQTLHTILKQKKELENSIEELKEYRGELDVTYHNLIKKSTQLEYSNEILERRVANLSNLNAVARTVLSIIELEKIIDIILDAYFVLTGAKKISLYLWEEGVLVNKKTKGNILFKGTISYPVETLEGFDKNDFKEVYEELSKGFIIDSTEAVIISDLNVKGKALGVIYIVEDREKLVDSDQETISALAIQVANAINNAKMYAELLIKERISKELEVASKIQKRILPKEMKMVCGLEIANYFEPAKEVGGDYYDYCLRDEDKVSITIADVSGKGIPAAFLMALIRSVLKTLNYKNIYPSEMLTNLNEIISPDINEDMFVTLFHSKYVASEKTLYYSNAGHNPLIIYKADLGKVMEYNVKGAAIGFIPEYQYKLGKVELTKGDILLYYTDGITEAENNKRDMFGIDRLKDIIYDNREKSAEEVKIAILEAINDFRGDYEQVDDLTFVVIRNNE